MKGKQNVIPECEKIVVQDWVWAIEGPDNIFKYFRGENLHVVIGLDPIR